MPTGSIREFATATGRDFRTVYRKIKKGDFPYKDAELVEETIKVYRVKWKQSKGQRVKSKE